MTVLIKLILQVVKLAIRDLWSLEYEIDEIQTEFAKGIGSIDIAHLTDDFVEDVMLQSKPLQGILMAIRTRQKVKKERASTSSLLESLTKSLIIGRYGEGQDDL